MKPITEYPYDPSLLTDKKFFWNCRTKEDIAAYHKKLARRTAGDNDYEALLSITQNNRKLLSLISSVTETIDGWTSTCKAAAMAALVLTRKPAVATEIGTWAGKGLLPIAFAMKEVGFGVVNGIDPYAAAESIKDQDPTNAAWWKDQKMHDDMKEKCLWHIKKFQVENFTNLIVKASNDVHPMACDLLSIDGNHGEQAITDVERFAPLVNFSGIVLLDDRRWIGGAVLRSEDVLEDLGFSRLFNVATGGDDWSMFQKIK